ncbi:hypothetical protein Daesc_005134 [Daldinia eschscholtzii]|uniref:Uncharacterized protein n=1 Tax=Daldinia eschscholtzii TaxID=292717 RepID=A0AAX6MJK8_9PEZI
MVLSSSSDDDTRERHKSRRSIRHNYGSSSDSSSSSPSDSSSSSSSDSSRSRYRHKSRSSRSKSHRKQSKYRKSAKRPTLRDRSKHRKSSGSSKSHRSLGNRSVKRKRAADDSDEDCDIVSRDLHMPSDMSSSFMLEEERILEFIKSGREWMLVNKPTVDKKEFMSMLPTNNFDKDYALKDYYAVIRQWHADPTKPLLLGQHTEENVAVSGRTPPKKPRRAERDSFGIVYRMFPRYYGITFEEFMGPKYQLKYDYSDNSVVNMQNGKRDHDPFPSKSFSENLRCLAAQNIWLENLELLATCIQYVNRVRTNDMRPWKLVNCDKESRFFRVWQNVIISNPVRQDMEALYLQVKQRLGPKPGFYQTFFNQITESVNVKVPKALRGQSHASKRTSDEDPYFIQTIDLAILVHALDNVSVWGVSLLRGAKHSSTIIQHATPGHDYPSDKKFSKARESSIIAHRALSRAAELRAKAQARRGPLIFLEDDDVDLSNRSPIKTSRNLSLLNLLSHSS